jgi:glycosyltransferase involved in cell wall biosynthesis
VALLTRKKLLLLITKSETGGAQKVVYHIAANLPPDQFDITAACAPGGQLIDWLKNLPQKITVVEMPELKRNLSPANDIKAFQNLYRLMKRETFDIVHCHSSKAGILGRLAARAAGVPKILFTVHGWSINDYQSFPVRALYTLAERLAGAVSTRIICVSQSDFNKGRDLHISSAPKMCVIYNGLPIPAFQAGKLREIINISKDAPIIGTVARLVDQKNPLFLLAVAAEIIGGKTVNSTVPAPYFVIIGDGPLRPDCERFINKNNLGGRVFLLGNRDDAAELIVDFDIFTLFSRWEGLPLTIIEAMLAELPVVASPVGGVEELVARDETGLLVNGSNPSMAARALEELLGNRERRIILGLNGRKKATGLFGIDNMVKSYINLYL